MVYLDSFILPTLDDEERRNGILDQEFRMLDMGYSDNRYPCGIFPQKQLERLDFEPITILYGGNGSGKSTLLNLVARKLELKRISPFNGSNIFDLYVKYCSFKMGYDDEGDKLRIPNGSRVITSDDIFDYMLNVRVNNHDIGTSVERIRAEREELVYAPTVRLKGLEDFEELREQLMARKLTGRQYVYKKIGQEVKLNSNGETALLFFEEKLKNDTLYLLDEPENSLSPKYQLELKKVLEKMARYCDCQFIIATHSPFILALENAKIYDLDSTPVDIKKWWELENTKTYYKFFKENEDKFK